MEAYYLERLLDIIGDVAIVLILAGLVAAVVGITRWIRRGAPGPWRRWFLVPEPPPRAKAAPRPARGPRTNGTPTPSRRPRPGERSGERDDERGAGTVLVVGIAAVVIMLALALAALGAAQQSRGIAQSAADLGALAGATALRHGLDPCDVARDAVERNHAALETCAPESAGVVGLTVSKALAATDLWTGGQARAGARAGPRPVGVASSG